MTTTPHFISSLFDIRPAACHASYPPGASNHTLHVCESNQHRDGYLIKPTRFNHRSSVYYVTQDERGWSAQKVKDGVAENWFIAANFESLNHLLTYLCARLSLFTVKDT